MKVLMAILFGTLFSAFFGYLLVHFKWDLLFNRWLNNKKEDWEGKFKRLVKIEALRMGAIFRRYSESKSSNYEENKNARKKNIQNMDKESQRILEGWNSFDSKTLKDITHYFKENGRLNLRGISLKVHMREVLSRKDYQKLKGIHLRKYLLGKLYLSILRSELMRGKNVNELIKLNEKVDFHKGLLLVYLLKCGGNEKNLREQLVKSSHILFIRLKSFPHSKHEDIDREMVTVYMSVRNIYNSIRNEARKQQKFEDEYIYTKNQSKQKKFTGSALNPLKYQDALKIMELSRVIDLNSLKKSYKKLAMKHHPDRMKAEGLSHEKKTHERFVKINAAFETLSRRHS
jgi:hypothetical protein